jgi:hypothetical protein
MEARESEAWRLAFPAVDWAAVDAEWAAIAYAMAAREGGVL